MPSSVIENCLDVEAVSVSVTDDEITVELEDGRTIIVPTLWYPRLQHATPAERANYEIQPYGITWPDVEADFSIRGLLLGQMSGESPASFKYWLDHRKKGRKVTFLDFVKHRHRPESAPKSGKRKVA